jgi:hemerythrin superfamily protein/ribosome-associated toxin RatA of RatAB toxin-antitoxin module
MTKVEKTVEVAVPVSTAYNQWTQFEEFPQFMGGVQQVEQLDDRTLRWVAEIAGVRRQWVATVLEQVPDQKVAWAATEGATNAGAVTFQSLGPDRTQVTLTLDYEPEGLVEKAGDALNIVERQATSDLERFKSFIESRGSETGGWRGEVTDEPHVGTPDVEDAAASRGDSGKAGVSGTVLAAGAAVAAAGVAAGVAAATSSSSSSSSSSEVVGGEDVIDILTTDHREATDLLLQIRAATDPTMRRDLADMLISELVRHAVAEEMYVYPAMKEHLPDGEAAVEHDTQEHKELERTMKELEGVEPSDPRFDSVLTQLETILADHVADEETEQFPQLRASISREELVQLGQKVQTAKKLAPTRPHPAAPNAELFHKLVGPGVGLVDRLRDRLTGRSTS